jgi:uncharacterized phage protein (predicted DNA packaging)
MSIVTLDDMKAHLGIIDDADDGLISTKIDAAQAHLESLLGYEIATEFASPLVVPADLTEAVMRLCAHYFENREATVVGISASELPMGVWETVSNRRHYSWSDDA